MDWLDLLAVQGTLKSLLQHHSSKASILYHSAFFIVQLSHPQMTTGGKKNSMIYCKKSTFYCIMLFAFLRQLPAPLPSPFSPLIPQCSLKDLFHNIRIPLYHQLLFRTFFLPLPQLDPNSLESLVLHLALVSGFYFVTSIF